MLNPKQHGVQPRRWISHSHTQTHSVYQAGYFIPSLFSVTHVSSHSLFSYFHFFLVFVCVRVFLLPSQVMNGQLVFLVTRGSTRPVRLRLDQVQVADGQWHDLQLELRDVRSGRETRYVATVRLDFGLYQVITQ